MTSLLMLAWMSILVALAHVRAERSTAESVAFMAVQTVCLVAGTAEAGREESGRETRGRRVFQAVALLSTLGYLILITVP